MNSALLHLVFFASGAVGLIYEVLWLRRFTVLFGATAPAGVATLSAFFLGLGIGSAIFGGRCPRWRRPLLAFGLIEGATAAAALAVEPILSLADAVMPHLAVALQESPMVLLAAKMTVAAMAIVPPAALMGGSLPVLAQAVSARRDGLGVRAGGLYAVNTLGAAVGCIAVPIVLLPALGAAGTLMAAMGGSLAVALAAITLDVVAPTTPPVPPPAASAGGRSSPRVTLMAAAFLSGAIALALEVLWSRMLGLVHENSIQSFATVVAIYLVGTGAGAAGGRWLLAGGQPARRLLGVGWIGAGLWVAVNPHLFWMLSSGLKYVTGSPGLLEHELRIAGLALATLFPATVLSGMALPALMEMAGREGTEAGPAVGRLLAANTVGAIAGPIMALFLAGWGLGLWWGIAISGLLLVAAGEGALRGGLRRSSLPGRLVFYVLLAICVLILRPGALPRARVQQGERLVSLREGAFGTVAVVEQEGHRRLQLNNHYVLGGTASEGEERLQGHIPLLLHPAPGTVAFLGLGTGITASAALFHPVRDVVVMELIPEVIEAARLDFRAANLGVLEDARVRAVADDARVQLRTPGARFDVIVGDLAVPWRRGESSLYTLEAFQSARRALAPGGIFCQWVPLFQLSRRQFDAIAATFLDVFPRTLLWRGDFRAGEPAVTLVGLTGDEPLDPAVIDARSRAYARHPDLSNPYLINPAGLWVFLVGAISREQPEFRAAVRSRDGRPLVELESTAVHVSDPEGPNAPFTGVRLKPFLESLLARPLAGTPLERIEPQHLLWRRAGARIWDASLLSLQGRNDEADQRALEALAMLPAPVSQAVLGRPLPPPKP